MIALLPKVSFYILCFSCADVLNSWQNLPAFVFSWIQAINHSREELEELGHNVQFSNKTQEGRFCFIVKPNSDLLIRMVIVLITNSEMLNNIQRE